MPRPAALALLLAALPAAAQQSLWNVPSGTATQRGGFFFQEQLNLARTGESNLTTAIGLGKGFEVGLNLFHVHLYSDPKPETARNMLMANAVFTLELTDALSMQMGAQLGFGREDHREREVPAGFGWLELRFHPAALKLAGVVGVWAGTETYVGKGWPAGPMLGLEYELVHEWLVLQGDLLMANNEAGVAVLGAVLLLPLGWQVALGLQLPSPFSHNGFGGVVELTYVPTGSFTSDEPASWQKNRFSPKWIREHREQHGEGDDDDGGGQEAPHEP